MPVRETEAMISGMGPRLVPGDVGFVSVATLDGLPHDARAVVREDEGITLVLPLSHALVPARTLAMRQITLSVNSALEGVGLTAAVASALAEDGIPCNVIAGLHHDHVFVPSADAERALAVLEQRAKQG